MVPGSTLILAISALATTPVSHPGRFSGRRCRRNCRRRLFVLARASLSPTDTQRLAPQSLSRVTERSAQLIGRFGAASVFLARFTAVVRAFVPLVAGIVRMSSRQFYLANILSALVWAPMQCFPWSVGRPAIGLGGVHAPELTLAAVGVLILAWIAWSMIKRKAANIVNSAAGQHAPGSSCGKSGPPPLTRRTAPDSRS